MFVNVIAGVGYPAVCFYSLLALLVSAVEKVVLVCTLFNLGGLVEGVVGNGAHCGGV